MQECGVADVVGGDPAGALSERMESWAHTQTPPPCVHDSHPSRGAYFAWMWIPHSSFSPCQRPDRGFSGSKGTVVQGSQPMLV